MERCVNTELLNGYMDELEKQEKMFEAFEKETEETFSEIEELIEWIKFTAKKYEDFDLDEHIKDTIMEML